MCFLLGDVFVPGGWRLRQEGGTDIFNTEASAKYAGLFSEENNNNRNTLLRSPNMSMLEVVMT